MAVLTPMARAHSVAESRPSLLRKVEFDTTVISMKNTFQLVLVQRQMALLRIIPLYRCPVCLEEYQSHPSRLNGEATVQPPFQEQFFQ